MSVITVTAANYEQEVVQSDKPVLIDFFATWCGPCRMVSPLIDEIAEERADIKVCKVDVDAESALAQQFGIVSIPMLAVVKNGQVVNQAVGAQPKESILAMLDTH